MLLTLIIKIYPESNCYNPYCCHPSLVAFILPKLLQKLLTGTPASTLACPPFQLILNFPLPEEPIKPQVRSLHCPNSSSSSHLSPSQSPSSSLGGPAWWCTSCYTPPPTQSSPATHRTPCPLYNGATHPLFCLCTHWTLAQEPLQIPGWLTPSPFRSVLKCHLLSEQLHLKL